MTKKFGNLSVTEEGGVDHLVIGGGFPFYLVRGRVIRPLRGRDNFIEFGIDNPNTIERRPKFEGYLPILPGDIAIVVFKQFYRNDKTNDRVCTKPGEIIAPYAAAVAFQRGFHNFIGTFVDTKTADLPSKFDVEELERELNAYFQ